MIQQIKKIQQNIHSFKVKINNILETIKNNTITKVLYWIFVIFLWWPVKYSFLFMYYILIWPFVKILGGSGSLSSSQSSGSSSLEGRLRRWKIEVYIDGMWWEKFSGTNENKQYISSQVMLVKGQNGGNRTRAVYADTGEMIDSA